MYVNFQTSIPENIENIYKDFYQDSPNIHLMKKGEIPEISQVAHTNNCQIGIYPSAIENQIIIISAIDNLVKGAAGQAIECYNLISGNDQMQGLKNG